MSQSNKSSKQRGKILIHEWDVDDDAPIIGGEETKNSELDDDYNTEFYDTISRNMEDGTRKDYRPCILCICNYWEQHCTVYHSTSVTIIPEDEYSNRYKFYFDGKYKRDIVYSGINITFSFSF